MVKDIKRATSQPFNILNKKRTVEQLHSIKKKKKSFLEKEKRHLIMPSATK